MGTGDVGDAALGNGAGGVYVGDTASGNSFAGSLPDVVSANGGNGFTLGANSSDTTMTGDIIGYAANGTLPLPNSGVPIEANARTGNTIGDNTVFPCFAAGTRLATPRGKTAVDDLH